MYKQDITGSIAHARMLGKIGVLTGEEKEAIVAGLQGILSDIDAGSCRSTCPARISTHSSKAN